MRQTWFENFTTDTGKLICVEWGWEEGDGGVIVCEAWEEADGTAYPISRLTGPEEGRFTQQVLALNPFPPHEVPDGW